MFARHPLPLMVTFVVLISSATLWAQADGQITGVVRDASGLVLPGATVTATNQATKASRNATTATDGSFTLSLPPGSYNVTVSVPGFQRVAQVVEVSAGASIKLDVTVHTTLAEEVTVTATKREQTLLNVPFSVAAPTEEVLRTRGVEDLEGVAANVVGLTVQNLGPGRARSRCVACRPVRSSAISRA